MDRLQTIRIFVRVAECGSFSRAAGDLHMTQPTVSRAIAAFEEATGVRLFNRTTRSVMLTETGERAYRRALAIIEEADALEAELRGADSAPVGLLRVSSSIAHTRAEIAPHTPAFLALYPHMRIDFATNDARVDLVAEGIDLAFRFGDLNDSSYTARALGAYQRMLVASPSFLERVGAIDLPEHLARVACIRFTAQLGPDEWHLATANGRSVRVRIDGPVSAATGRVVRDLAVMGLGVAMAPCFMIRNDIASGALVRILPDWSGPPAPLHALWPSGRNLPRKARAFLDYIAPKLTTYDGEARPLQTKADAS